MSWTFRLAPGIRLEQASGPGVYRLALPSGRRLRFVLDPPGEIAVEEDAVAPGYGTVVTAVVLRRRLGSVPREARVEIGPAPAQA